MREPRIHKIMDEVRKDTTKLVNEGSVVLVDKATKPSGSGEAKLDAAKVRDNLKPYEDYLSFFSEVKALDDSNLSSNSDSTKMVTLPNANRIREEYQDIASKDSDFLVPECPRLRILVMGQQGVGKSTICSKVLGISAEQVCDQTLLIPGELELIFQAGVSHRGTGTAASAVWDEITGLQNTHLILHDSGGFRPNRDGEMKEIQSFIQYRRDQKLLKDQLHCIWSGYSHSLIHRNFLTIDRYCVSSTGPRNLQDDGVEGDFFKLDTGQIPVFVIFTKFDLLIKDHRDQLEEENPSLSQKTPQQRMFAGQEPAFNDYRDFLEAKIIRLARGKPQVKICRASIPLNKATGEHKEYKLLEYRQRGMY